MQLAPGSVPLLPRKPAINAKPIDSSALTQAAPASAWSPKRLSSSSPAQQSLDGMTVLPEDAVYLDSLEQPGPPEVKVASLNEQNIAPANQVLAEPQAPLPPGARDGVFQKIYITGTYLPALTNQPDALGWGDF